MEWRRYELESGKGVGLGSREGVELRSGFWLAEKWEVLAFHIAMTLLVFHTATRLW